MRPYFFLLVLAGLFLPVALVAQVQTASWTANSGEISSPFQAFLFDSTGGILAGTKDGAYSSSDNGESWIRNMSLGQDPNIYSFFRSKDGTLLCGLFVLSSPVLYRSTNNGSSWMQVAGISRPVTSFAATSQGNIVGNAIAAPYLSTDGGLTWNLKPIYYTGIRQSIYAIAVNGIDSIFAATAVGVFRSADLGDHWTRLGNGYPESSCWSLHFDVDGVLYAGSDSCIYISSDNGNSWAKNGFTNGSVRFLATGKTKTVCAASKEEGVFLSTDHGSTWQTINNNLPSSSYHVLVSFVVKSDSLGGETMFAGTESGLFRSTNAGTNWSKVSDGLKTAVVQSLYTSSISWYSLLAGANGRGIYGQLGSTWIKLLPVSPTTRVTSFTSLSGGYMFAGAESSGVFRSTDGGKTWQSKSAGIAPLPVYSMCALGGNIVLAGSSQGVFKSSDYAGSWTPASSGLGAIAVNAFVPISQLPDTVFAGSANGIYRSLNGGSSWSGSGLAGKSINCLGIGASGELFAGANDGTYRSLDSGQTWELIGTIQLLGTVRSLATSYPQSLFAGGDLGVFISADNGTSWQPSLSGLGSLDVRSLVYMYGTLVAGTGAGVFTSIPLVPSLQQTDQWMAVGSLQSWYSQMGSEEEEGFVLEQQYGLQWPAIFPHEDMQVGKALWIAVDGHTYPGGTVAPFVVHIGPRVHGTNEFYPLKLETVSKFESPLVKVNGYKSIGKEDATNSIDTAMRADRMIVNIANTAAGITMTRKIMQFSQEYHDNYIIYDYLFKNTGNTNGDPVIENPTQSLSGVYFYFLNRYGICADTRYVIGRNPTGWGINTMNDARGDGNTYPNTFFPGNQDNDVRAQYSWHGKYPPFTAYDNIGGPVWIPYYDKSDTVGRLGAPQFVGTATIHADKSAKDVTDDVNQPATMAYQGSDESNTVNNDCNNSAKNTAEYAWVTRGRVTPRHADLVGPTGDPALGTPGGFSNATGYGPYTLAPNDSVHIVIVEAASGLSLDARMEIGKAYKKSGANNTQTITYNGVAKTKNDWVYTGRDSLFQTFRRAIANVNSAYAIPQPPRPPKSFSVVSAAGKILLSWDVYAVTDPRLKGFEIYRAPDKIQGPYIKIASLTSEVRSFDDVTILIGKNYYYYIVSVGDSIANNGVGQTPLGVLRSSHYYTQTYTPVSSLTSVKLINDVPARYSLMQNYPNPFNPTTCIDFAIARRGFVALAVYDILGRRVATLVEEEMNAGSYVVQWNASSFANGVYFYRLTAGSFSDVKKMLLLK